MEEDTGGIGVRDGADANAHPCKTWRIFPAPPRCVCVRV